MQEILRLNKPQTVRLTEQGNAPEHVPRPFYVLLANTS